MSARPSPYARQAVELRLDGLTWREIAARLHYANERSARGAALGSVRGDPEFRARLTGHVPARALSADDVAAFVFRTECAFCGRPITGRAGIKFCSRQCCWSLHEHTRARRDRRRKETAL